MFPLLTGGTLHSMMQSMKLEMQWQQRKENPYLKKGQPEDPQIKQLRAQAERARKGAVVSGLDAKLKSGSLLSDDEMAYLRTNNPELYQKALEVARERARYKKELEACRTKEDVERLNARRTQEFMAEAKTISQNPNIGAGKKQELLDQVLRKFMNVRSEHVAFTKSERYASLPTDEDVRKREKEKRAQSGDVREEEAEQPVFHDPELARKLEEMLMEELRAAEKGAKNAEEALLAGEKEKSADTITGAGTPTDTGKPAKNPAPAGNTATPAPAAPLNGTTATAAAAVPLPTLSPTTAPATVTPAPASAPTAPRHFSARA